ncbi:hypothetical protein HDV06_002238 [Boothiomyces sp. JEL0866]|nr:hypothetical protein HDV06_002238 [Boothiomyces sp. JEL0866]
MQLPFHLVITLTGLDKLLFVSGSKIVILESKTGKIATISESLGKAERVIPNDQHAKKQLRTIVYHPAKKLLAFVSDDKELQIWDAQSLKVINKRLSFSKDAKHLMVADKFGDLYKLTVDNPDEKPLLLIGHVSILTDMSFTSDSKYLVTSDRDEKIRVNKYPETFDIHQFLLGHTVFVSKVLALENSKEILISGGGDDWLGVWNYTTGKLIQKLDIVTGLELGEVKPTVIALKAHYQSHTLAVLLEKLNYILIFDLTDLANVKQKKFVKLEREPLSFAFDASGNIWIANNSAERKVDFLSRESLEAVDSPLLKPVNSVHTDEGSIDANIVEEMFELYEIGHMRKWSRWQPDPNYSLRQKRKDALEHDIEKEESKKKTRRGGQKQKEKKAKIAAEREADQN